VTGLTRVSLPPRIRVHGVLGAILVLVVWAAGNALGSTVLRVRGFGLISFARSAPILPWRASVARLAGPLAVYLLAFLMFAVSLRYFQRPTSRVEVAPGFPAQAAGLESGDRIVEVGGQAVTSFPQLVDHISNTGPGRPVDLVVLRGDRRIPLRPTTDAESRIGVRPSGEMETPPRGETTLSALKQPFRTVADAARVVLEILRGRRVSPADGQLEFKLKAGDPAPGASLLYAIAVNCSMFWPFMVLLALATQVVAVARGEFSAPAPGRG